MKKILFLCMPYARPSFGSLALGTLKSICRQAGIDSEIRYLNIELAKAIGECLYLQMGEVHDGEICFTADLFPEVPAEETWRQYLALGGTRAPAPGSSLSEELRHGFLDLAKRKVPAFLDRCMAGIPWSDFDVVGFSVGFNQTISSLALATRIRKRYPEKIIVFGGASCDGEAGPAFLDHFEVLDVVVSGPADELIVPLINALRRHEPIDRWPQVHSRATRRAATVADGRSKGMAAPTTPAPEPYPETLPADLDRLPIPDFGEYFQAVADLESSEPIMIPYESSRGCWWGAKGQCSFCGLNGSTIAFRPKAAARVLAELRAQYERYGVTRFYACDCILGMSFLDSLLPGLQELHESYGLSTFYELRSNLRTEQVYRLRRAGITRIQPGIESFSDHVLQLMNKGTNGLNQVRFLRDCVSAGLEVRYGILWGNPGERAEDYHGMSRILPFLHHLPPPHYLTPMTLQKFSPYSQDPARYGMEDIEPAGIYRVMYGDRPYDYSRLAYILSFKHAMCGDEDLRSGWQELATAVSAWRSAYQPYRLTSTELDGTLYVADRRDAEPDVLAITGLKKALLDACANGRSQAGVERLADDHAAPRLDEELAALVERRLMLPWDSDKGTRYLSLPVSVSPRGFSTIIDEIRARDDAGCSRPSGAQPDAADRVSTCEDLC